MCVCKPVLCVCVAYLFIKRTRKHEVVCAPLSLFALRGVNVPRGNQPPHTICPNTLEHTHSVNGLCVRMRVCSYLCYLFHTHVCVPGELMMVICVYVDPIRVTI